jgi:hypothetical protein
VPNLSLPLAVQDFVPVLVSAIGWLFVVRVVARAEPSAGRLAAIGAVLVVGGGLSRATWKIIVALDGPDVGLLHAGLYPLLVTGFLALAGALWAANSGRAPGFIATVLPVVTVALLGVLTLFLDPSRGRTVPIVWLAVATVGSVAVGILLALRARRIGRLDVATLFVVAIISTLLLNGLARLSSQSEGIQWLEQGLNTLTQAVFALAAWQLWRTESRSVGKAMLTSPRDEAGQPGPIQSGRR